MCHDVLPALPPPAHYPDLFLFHWASLKLFSVLPVFVVFFFLLSASLTTITHLIYLFLFAESYSLSCLEVSFSLPPLLYSAGRLFRNVLRGQLFFFLLPVLVPLARCVTLIPHLSCSLHQTQLFMKVAGLSSSTDQKQRTNKTSSALRVGDGLGVDCDLLCTADYHHVNSVISGNG